MQDETAERGVVCEAFRIKAVYPVYNQVSAADIEKYLSGFLKEYTGKSYQETLEDIRRRNAVDCLTQTDQPIGDIAKACGFGSQNSFYKAFRRVFGVSPGMYREKIPK